MVDCVFVGDSSWRVSDGDRSALITLAPIREDAWGAVEYGMRLMLSAINALQAGEPYEQPKPQKRWAE
jgi:hypothetical protein